MTANGQAADFAVVIPAYREAGRISAVVAGARRQAPRVVVVDDGSDDATAAEAAAAGAEVLRHERNLGKGAALNTALRYAREQGFPFVITMDGDGQHAPEDIAGFVEARERRGARVVVGNRMEDPRGMPLVRRCTNRFMSWLLSRQMGQDVPDSQCGFRLYGREVYDLVIAESERFAAESEVLLALAEAGVRILSAPARLIYGTERSEIRPWRDTWSFFAMLRRRGRRRSGGGQRDIQAR